MKWAIHIALGAFLSMLGIGGVVAVWPLVAGDGIVAYQRGDYDAAFRLWRAGARRGNAAAAFDLGLLYQAGEGVEQDYAQAARWFTRAAEQGFVLAQVNLGAMYAAGAGVLQDDGKAASWLRQAAKQGNKYADFNLSFLYRQGRVEAQSEEEIQHWVLLAAADDDRDTEPAKLSTAADVKGE